MKVKILLFMLGAFMHLNSMKEESNINKNVLTDYYSTTKNVSEAFKDPSFYSIKNMLTNGPNRVKLYVNLVLVFNCNQEQIVAAYIAGTYSGNPEYILIKIPIQDMLLELGKIELLTYLKNHMNRLYNKYEIIEEKKAFYIPDDIVQVNIINSNNKNISSIYPLIDELKKIVSYISLRVETQDAANRLSIYLQKNNMKNIYSDEPVGKRIYQVKE